MVMSYEEPPTTTDYWILIQVRSVLSSLHYRQSRVIGRNLAKGKVLIPTEWGYGAREGRVSSSVTNSQFRAPTTLVIYSADSLLSK